MIFITEAIKTEAETVVENDTSAMYIILPFTFS